MTCSIAIKDGRITIDDPSRLLTGKHHSQLCYWGFDYGTHGRNYTGGLQDGGVILEKVTGYFNRHHVPYVVSPDIQAMEEQNTLERKHLHQAIRKGMLVKAGNTKVVESADFLQFLSTRIPRALKEHQVKAALHLISVGNGANFSVPGSGKTTVVLSVFEWLRNRGELDSLFVVGPLACFAPWRSEYESVIGRSPNVEVLAGGDAEDRRRKYYVSSDKVSDLYLTSYQTLQRDWEQVKVLLNQKSVRFALVVDEAHYIKQLDGAWAASVLNVAKYARTRIVLTGTPFPQSYVDAFNLFDVLWPGCSPINQEDKIRITHYVQKKKEVEATQLLDQRISPLFYRVRKQDLGLAPQNFRPPVRIEMNKHERLIYDAILDKILSLSKEDFSRDWDLRLRLRRGRMMRLRQCLSYAHLLQTAVLDYSENLLQNELSLAGTIKQYDSLESPAKLNRLLEIVEQLRKGKKKVVVWSNFVGTLKLIQKYLLAADHGVGLIYGETPTEKEGIGEEATRESIIAEFTSPTGGLNVLVANPAACAESISLHKECSTAIYYDLSYNCAQYLQSLDRIHRVGGSENRSADYYFLQYVNTIDEDILANVQRKAANMSAVIDLDYPIYSLDMFSADDELEAYERLFK
jgi:SNF2 family DNA or RNA helicase